MIKNISCIIFLSIISALMVFGLGIEDDNKSVYYFGQANGNESAFLASILYENEYGKIKPVEEIDRPEYQSKKVQLIKPKSYRHIIFAKSKEYEIEPSLVYAVIRVESNWDTKALSRSGAKGLMQLMPSTAKEMNVKDPYDPEENIEGGIRYLKYLLDKFNGDITLALAAYNAGPNKVRKFRGVPPIKETRRYVKKVLSFYNEEIDL